MAYLIIVDDDADYVDAVSSVLTQHGYQVVTARNGEEGLKRAKLERPDLIIMDIIMNERTEGFFVVQEIRRTPDLKSVPIIVLSTIYAQEADFRVAPERGWLAHDEFLAKPVDVSVLLEKIDGRLGSRI